MRFGSPPRRRGDQLLLDSGKVVARSTGRRGSSGLGVEGFRLERLRSEEPRNETEGRLEELERREFRRAPMGAAKMRRGRGARNGRGCDGAGGETGGLAEPRPAASVARERPQARGQDGFQDFLVGEPGRAQASRRRGADGCRLAGEAGESKQRRSRGEDRSAMVGSLRRGRDASGFRVSSPCGSAPARHEEVRQER